MIKLYHAAQTRSFRILWLAHELGLEIEIDRRSFFDGSMKSPEYQAANRSGRIPALEIDGKVITESGAILQYLCERENRLLGAQGERAQWLEWVHYAETLAGHTMVLTQQHIVFRPDARNDKLARLETKRLAAQLAVVEKHLAGPYLLPSGFSAADIAVQYAVEVGRRFVRLDPFPRLQAWMQTCAARPAYQAALAEDGPPEIYHQDFYGAEHD